MAMAVTHLLVISARADEVKEVEKMSIVCYEKQEFVKVTITYEDGSKSYHASRNIDCKMV